MKSTAAIFRKRTSCYTKVVASHILSLMFRCECFNGDFISISSVEPQSLSFQSCEQDIYRYCGLLIAAGAQCCSLLEDFPRCEVWPICYLTFDLSRQNVPLRCLYLAPLLCSQYCNSFGRYLAFWRTVDWTYGALFFIRISVPCTAA